MQNSKQDRRVSRTRRNLRNALMSLILEKGYDSVTIEEITQRADVGRTTFYLHYKDKEDLLIENIDAIIDEFIGQISSVPLSAWAMSLEEDGSLGEGLSPVLLVFQHAADNEDLYRVMLRGEGVSRAQNQIRSVISHAVRDFLQNWVEKDHLVITPSVSLDFFTNYFAGSLMGILTWWLEKDMPYEPLKMAIMFQKMFYPGAKEVLGVGSPEME
ncbi:MAG: TetR/AcrR family transcriptional regulator [Anaerolineales bacterium]